MTSDLAAGKIWLVIKSNLTADQLQNLRIAHVAQRWTHRWGSSQMINNAGWLEGVELEYNT